MREIIIKSNESGQRFDKLLRKYLPEAPSGFVYKMLRKKNILLNGKKASGSEKLKERDTVKLFLSDETIEKFSSAKGREEYEKLPPVKLDILYEDTHVLAVNKPAGMLSQKAKPGDTSLVEYVIQYLLRRGSISQEDLCTFKPSVCNRLDRNTSGIIMAGKSLAGLQKLGELFQERTLFKYYLCLVNGKIREPRHICGYLCKDKRTNMVTVKQQKETEKDLPIETEYEPVAWSQELSLLRVHLVTGRAHQIRAHLALIGHPILGDPKYGTKKFPVSCRENYKLQWQMLHAYELVMPELTGEFAPLSERRIYAPVPGTFYEIIKETAWEHGTREALEVLH